MPWSNAEVLAFLNERGVGVPVAHPGEPYCFLCASHLTDPGNAEFAITTPSPAPSSSSASTSCVSR